MPEDTSHAAVTALFLSYSSIKHLSGNLYEVCDGGNYGICRTDGRIIVPCQYPPDIKMISDSLFLLGGNSLCHGVYSSKQKKLVIPIRYAYIKHMTDDLFSVATSVGDKKYGVWSIEKRDWLIPQMYDYIDRLSAENAKHAFSPDFYRIGTYANKGRVAGVFSALSGKIVVPIEYDDVVPISDTLIRVCRYNESKAYYGVFSTQSDRFVLPVVYTSIKEMGEFEYKFPGREKYFKVERNEKQGLLLADGTLAIPVVHHSICCWLSPTMFSAGNLEEKKWVYGVYQIGKKTPIVPCEFDEIAYLTDTLFLVTKDQQTGVYDTATKNLTLRQ